MKQVILSQKALSKVKENRFSFFEKDFEGNLPSFIPGEFVAVKVGKDSFLFTFNTFNTKGVIAYRLSSVMNLDLSCDERELGKSYVLKQLQDTYDLKKALPYFNEGLRLVSGSGDYLCGLIVDIYQNYILIQINSAAIDRFRTEIDLFLKERFQDKKILFIDDKKQRDKESLPVYAELSDFSLNILENSFLYTITSKLIQKNGYYYDHRENRARLERIIKESVYHKGLDLFSYLGSWGLHLLRAGVENVVFVDQGDLKDCIDQNLTINNFQGRGQFIRSDVFEFLDKNILEKKKYDVIMCDPPAFKKSVKSIQAALHGYTKLYEKIFSVLDENAMLAVASCTHGVSYNDLDKIINMIALKQKRHLYLYDMGLQSRDHSVVSLNAENFYIKYLLYKVF